MKWPSALDPQTICFSVDVEWAAPEVLSALRHIFDERGIRVTFFLTHDGAVTGDHERGLHPNFRRNGDAMKALGSNRGGTAPASEVEVYRHVLSWTRRFAPDARGLRCHSLFFDSQLLSLLPEFGLGWASNVQLPLAEGLRPFWKEYGILELPIWWSDYFELRTQATGFQIGGLGLDRPGLKVINLHPNIIFLNASSERQYLETKSFYHDVDRLQAARNAGAGARDLLFHLLDAVASRSLPTATLGDVEAIWRREVPAWT